MFLLDDAILNNKMNNKDTIKIPKSCIITTTTDYLFIFFYFGSYAFWWEMTL